MKMIGLLNNQLIMVHFFLEYLKNVTACFYKRSKYIVFVASYMSPIVTKQIFAMAKTKAQISFTVTEKTDFCLGENKGTDQLRSDCEAEQEFQCS